MHQRASINRAGRPARIALDPAVATALGPADWPGRPEFRYHAPMVRLRIVGILAALFGAVGCYEAPKPACQFLCGSGDACPTDYGCGDDGRCHRVESNGSLAVCTDQLPGIDAAATIDSSMIDSSGLDADLDAADIDAMPIDATPIDATPIDAMPIDAMPLDAPMCSSSYTVSDDGSGAARQALVITEINPGAGGYIELYNNTASAINLGTSAYQLCSPFDYAALSAAGVGAGITIQPGGFATVGWPAAFMDVDAGGEVILYLDSATGFGDGAKIMDFVCWGTNPHGSRQALAESSGKWTAAGACPGVLGAGAIHRLTATTGRADADYDVASAPSPTTCE